MVVFIQCSRLFGEQICPVTGQDFEKDPISRPPLYLTRSNSTLTQSSWLPFHMLQLLWLLQQDGRSPPSSFAPLPLLSLVLLQVCSYSSPSLCFDTFRSKIPKLRFATFLKNFIIRTVHNPIFQTKQTNAIFLCTVMDMSGKLFVRCTLIQSPLSYIGY